MFGMKKMSKEEEFMKLLARLSFVQMVGVAKLLEIEPDTIKECLLSNDSTDMVVEMTVKFLKKNRIQRREIIKFLKKVVKENEEEENEKVEEKDDESLPQSEEVTDDGTEEMPNV